MSIIGLVFPTLFQQTDPCTSLERNSLRSKCSSVADIVGTRGALQDIKCQKYSSDCECRNESFSQNVPGKTTTKRKKKKKGKSKVLQSENNNTLECGMRNDKELINKSVHGKIDAKHYSMLSESNRNPDNKCLITNNKSSLNIAADTECLTSSEHTSVPENIKVNGTKPATTSSFHGNSNIIEAHITPGNGICRNSEKHERGSSNGISLIEKANKGNFQVSNNTSRILCPLNNRNNAGKENANLTWQKTGRCIGSSQTKIQSQLNTTSLLKSSSLKNDGLLQPVNSQQNVKYSGDGVLKPYTSQEISDLRRDYYVSRSNDRLTLPSKQENCSYKRKGMWVSKHKLSTCEPEHEIKPSDGPDTKLISSIEHRSLFDSSIEGKSYNLPCNSSIKELTSEVSGHDWISVGKKDSMLENHNQEVGKEYASGASSVLDMTKNVHEYNGSDNCGQGFQWNNRNYFCFAHDGQLKNFYTLNCSDMVEKAMEASHISQIASESYKVATGIPIAEFEKLLLSAAPVIKSEPSLNAYSNFKITLRDVWNWYEEPGNYGLQVKAEDHQLNASLQAHFVPYLSAIQLFGLHHNFEQCSCPYHSELAETSSSSYPSDNYHVIFEYFENEPPQQRKPLFAKIKELLKVDTSNSQIFGDPSKLECMDIKDIHFASWYSVAWYPIYRIPEGCFRASFLTYHSLSHLQLRRMKLDSTEKTAFCVVSPVLGMQSYNAQGECWFKSKQNDAYVLLKQRIKALEETAALFSRGRVHKGSLTVTNRHPDYEFFLSRKH